MNYQALITNVSNAAVTAWVNFDRTAQLTIAAGRAARTVWDRHDMTARTVAAYTAYVVWMSGLMVMAYDAGVKVAQAMPAVCWSVTEIATLAVFVLKHGRLNYGAQRIVNAKVRDIKLDVTQTFSDALRHARRQLQLGAL